DDYLDPSHPVQVRNRATLAAFAGCAVDAIGVDVDGCGAPTFSLALPAAARAFASRRRGPGPGACAARWHLMAGACLPKP
ncbi:MAG: asparaginase, partial [Alphaproteobacteria bacterium]